MGAKFDTSAYAPVRVIPRKTLIPTKRTPRIGYRVTVSGEEYDASLVKMWSEDKPDATEDDKPYNRGLGNHDGDPRRVERSGRLGEIALAKLLGLTVDLSYREYGDDQDMILDDGRTLDIKTATEWKTYECGLVRGANSGKTKIPLKCDVYVFAYVSYEDRVNRWAVINIVGWQTAEFISALPLVGARKKSSKHKNHEVPYSVLLPIDQLARIYG